MRLRGKTPVLFFDEFDSTMDRQEYYWLKHFLAPLQDGVFRSGANTHRLGRSIFVFAGSVCHSFAQFEEACGKPNGETHASASSDDHKANFKGTDFLSRLQGYIDIGGLSPEAPREEPVQFVNDLGGLINALVAAVGGEPAKGETVVPRMK